MAPREVAVQTPTLDDYVLLLLQFAFQAAEQCELSNSHCPNQNDTAAQVNEIAQKSPDGDKDALVSPDSGLSEDTSDGLLKLDQPADDSSQTDKKSRRVFNCRFCTYSSGYRANIVVHERTHTGERPYECSVCLKRFAQYSAHKAHQKVHAHDSAKAHKAVGAVTRPLLTLAIVVPPNGATSAVVAPSSAAPGTTPIVSSVVSSSAVPSSNALGTQAVMSSAPHPPSVGPTVLVPPIASSMQHSQALLSTVPPAPASVMTSIMPRTVMLSPPGMLPLTIMPPLSRSLCSNPVALTRPYDIAPSVDFQCSQCSFHTKYKHSLVAHARTHSGERPFECGVCAKRFTQLGARNVHEKSHEKQLDEKPGADESGSSPHRDRRFSCAYCSYGSYYKNSVKLHQRTHTGERPYECEVCLKRFAYPSAISNHRKLHRSSGDLTAGAAS